MKIRRDDVGLDQIDRQILGLLQVDCKTALATLGDTVGLSAPSVVERIRRLESEGFIEGYHAALRASRLRIDITAFIGLSIDRPEVISGFERKLADLRDVLECHHVTGEHSLLLKIKTRNTKSLEALISRLRSIHGVARTHTYVVLSTPFERAQLDVSSGEVQEAEKSAKGGHDSGV
jgi:Lrp/AsnC family transcriptional regulator, leucine-responsive regulatory protein